VPRDYFFLWLWESGGIPSCGDCNVLLTLLSPSAAAAAVGLVVTLVMPLLCEEQSLYSPQHLPRALAAALVVVVLVELVNRGLYAPVSC
jgi:hypothetical protein